MAHITIKDLPQSIELDRNAMRTIVGGSRVGVRPIDLAETKTTRSVRVVDYPRGFVRDKMAEEGKQGPAV